MIRYQSDWEQDELEVEGGAPTATPRCIRAVFVRISCTGRYCTIYKVNAQKVHTPRYATHFFQNGGPNQTALPWPGDGLLRNVLSHQIFVPVHIFSDDDRAMDFLTKSSLPEFWQFGRELQTACPLDRIDRHLKVPQRLVVGNGRIGQHKRAHAHIPSRRPIFGKYHLIEVGWHRNIGRGPNDLVRDPPLAIIRVALRQVKRSGDDPHGGIGSGEPAAEVLKMRPVIPVEAIADLRAHVGQQEGLVESLLAPFRVGGWHLVAAIVAGARVVLQLGSELRGHALVFDKVAVLAVGVIGREGCGGDVLGYPERVPRAAIECARCAESWAEVIDGTGEPILE